MEMMDKIQQEQLNKIQEAKDAKGIDDIDKDSQGILEGEQKEDPKEVLKHQRIMNAERRRDEWVRHQAEELQESPVHDHTFRKGIYRGAHIAKHQFRESAISADYGKALAAFFLPKTPNTLQNKMTATADG